MVSQDMKSLCWTETEEKDAKQNSILFGRHYPLSRTDSKHRLNCTPCKKNVMCHHQGIKDKNNHYNGAIHKADVKSLKQTHDLRSMLPSCHQHINRANH